MSSRVEQFSDLVRLQPDNELFRFSLAQALVAAGHGPEAVPHFEFCISKRPDWMMPHILLGKLLIGLGRKDDARPLLQVSLRLAREQHHEDPERELTGMLAEL